MVMVAREMDRLVPCPVVAGIPLRIERPMGVPEENAHAKDPGSARLPSAAGTVRLDPLRQIDSAYAEIEFERNQASEPNSKEPRAEGESPRPVAKPGTKSDPAAGRVA